MKSAIILFAIIFLGFVSAEKSCQPGTIYCQGQCCEDDMKCVCDNYFFHHGVANNYTEQQTFFKPDNKKKVHVNNIISIMEDKNNVWQISKTIPSKDASIGDFILWPVTFEGNNAPRFEVMKLEHHNVTERHVTCCIGLYISTGGCGAKLCCGGGCCC